MGMRNALLGLGQQMQRSVDGAADTSQQVTSLVKDTGISAVVLAGMGGSGIAGDIVRAVGATNCQVPITVVKGYECPAFVGPTTLLLALSFSGNTEETLSVTQSAHAAGANVISVSSGGELTQLATRTNTPCYEVDATIPMPRAAVGAMVIPPLLALAAAGLLSDAAQQIAMAIAQVNTRLASLSNPTGQVSLSNRAAQDSLLLVCGAGNLGAAAALRWKTQINENAKLPALLGELPELCHNELAGWQVSPEVAEKTLPYFLRHDYEHPQNKRRFEFYADVLSDAGVARPIEVAAVGSGPLAQMFDLMVIGDDLSLRLAASMSRDPGPVDILMNLKAHLAK